MTTTSVGILVSKTKQDSNNYTNYISTETSNTKSGYKYTIYREKEVIYMEINT